MGALFSFILGIAVGYIACLYRQKLTRIKDTVGNVIKVEFGNKKQGS